MRHRIELLPGTPQKCACGLSLHYTSQVARQSMERLIELLGPTIRVATSAGVWRVPRHYIALHGVKAEELPELAARLGFARETSRP